MFPMTNDNGSYHNLNGIKVHAHIFKLAFNKTIFFYARDILKYSRPKLMRKSALNRILGHFRQLQQFSSMFQAVAIKHSVQAAIKRGGLGLDFIQCLGARARFRVRLQPPTFAVADPDIENNPRSHMRLWRKWKR
jgi:hypothetical protein